MNKTGGKKFIADSSGVVDGCVFVEKPYYVRSRNNGRGSWVVQHKRDKEARMLGQWMAAEAVKLGCNQLGWEPSEQDRWVVTMTRYSTGLLDDDNLSGSFKSVRDGIADVLKTGDGPGGRVTWRYGQTKSRAFGARIVLERLNKI